MTMTTGPSPTSPETDDTSNSMEVSNPSTKPPSKPNTTETDDQSVTSKDSIQVVQVKSGHGIYSSQPRFYIPAIQSRFQHTKDRFCYKIKVSFPWIDSTVPPTMGTYYTSIQNFFSLVNKHDNQFEILPWDLRRDTEKTINHYSGVPSLHSDLSQYVYNLQLTKTRIRFSCVITLSSNFRKVFRQKESIHNKLSLLQQMQQKAIWVQETDLQTMGDQKIIGYLQNIHPNMTDQKKLLTDLQSIVETRDISIELFRPRALNSDGTLIASTEALAVTVPIDISNQMHTSLTDKWDDIKKGYYNDIIGDDSLLITSYFIPFKRGICTPATRNRSICLQKEYNRNRSGIYITQCNTIDTKFKLSHEEAKTIGVDHWDISEQITLRTLLMSYKQPDTDIPIVETIQDMGYGNFVIVIQKQYVTLITDSVSILLDTLTARDDYNSICDTKVQTKPRLRVKKLSKKSQKYIADLQATIMRIGDKDDVHTKQTPTKRKHNNRDVNYLLSNTERVSPDLKKSSIQSINSEDSGFSSPEQANVTRKPPPRPIAIKKSNNSSMLKTLPNSQKQSQSKNPSYIQIAMSTKKITTPTNQFNTFSRTNNNTKLRTTPTPSISPQGQRPPTLIPLSQREPPTAISTTSTLTPNTGLVQRNAQFSNDQVLQLKKTFQQQYDNALGMMEISYSKKFDALTASNQRQIDSIHSKIDQVNNSCKSDIDQVRKEYLSFQSQFKEQTDMLATNSVSLNEQKTMLATITEVLTRSNNEHNLSSSYRKLQKRRDKKLQKKKDKKKKTRQKPIPLSEFSSSDDNDLSYSDIDLSSPTEKSSISKGQNHSTVTSNHCRTLEQDFTPSFSNNTDPPSPFSTSLELSTGDNNCKSQSHSSSKTVSTSKTESTDLSTLTNDDGWKTIPTTQSTVNKINHMKCVKSPPTSKGKIYNKDSPNYNHYDPTGEFTQRRSARLQGISSSSTVPDHPHSSPNRTPIKKTRGGRTT
jgi:hypothetical protein